MARAPHRFPRAAGWLLARILPPTPTGRTIIGDLVEEYTRLPRGWRRICWCWWTVADVGLRYLPGRFVTRRYAARHQRDGRRAGPFSGIGGDLRHAARLGRRHPWPVAAAVLSLGLGIGVGTAAFSVVNGSYLRLYLSADPALVQVWRAHHNGTSALWPEAEVRAVREQTRLATIEPWATSTVPLSTDRDDAGAPRSVQFVGGHYFTTIGTAAATGRLIAQDDDRAGRAPVAVLSHRLWRQQFGGDRSAIGKSMWVAGVRVPVVGVTARDYVDPGSDDTDLWLPLSAASMLPTSGLADRPPDVRVVARLAPGGSVAQAEAELSRLAQTMGASAARPATGASIGPTAGTSMLSLTRRVVIGAIVLAGLVVLLSSANAANLLVAGVVTRQREIAVRRSLGASRFRLWRQVMVESAALTAASAVAGLLLATWLAPILAAQIGFAPTDGELDLRVFAFSVLIAAGAALVAGIGPGREAGRRDSVIGVKGGAGQGRRARSAIVALQSAVAIILLAGGTLLLKTVMHLAWKDPGFDADRVLVVSATLPRSDDRDLLARDYWIAAQERIRVLPGVAHVGLAAFPPFGMGLGDPEQLVENATDAGYFSALGLRMLRGRTYSDEEVAARAPVAVIGRAVAQAHWGDEDPVGQSLERVIRKPTSIQIIEVVDDVFMVRVHERPTPVVYVPMPGYGSAQLVVRTAEPRAVADAVGAALTAMKPEYRPRVWLPLDQLARRLERPRRFAALAAGLGIFALMLAAGGLVGVTAFHVRTRLREMAIRLAVGATNRDLMGQFLRQGLRPIAIGLCAGVGLVLAGGQLIAGLLHGLSPRDPVALGAATLLLAAAAVGAIALAVRASLRTDPAALLRGE
jgi:predicted permease